jgi:hypothetical protein
MKRRAYARDHKSLPARAYFSVGDQEAKQLFESFLNTLRGSGMIPLAAPAAYTLKQNFSRLDESHIRL